MRVASFRSEPLFPRSGRALATILSTSKVVTPIDVLVGMHLLAPEKVLTEGLRCDLARTASYKVFWKSGLRIVRPAGSERVTPIAKSTFRV